MELQKITSMIMVASERIDKATREIYKMADEKAQTEYEYRKALAKEITTLQAKNMPVTIINDVAKGNVADLKLQRDLADGKYKSAIESLRALQNELSGLQSILKVQPEIGG